MKSAWSWWKRCWDDSWNQMPVRRLRGISSKWIWRKRITRVTFANLKWGKKQDISWESWLLINRSYHWRKCGPSYNKLRSSYWGTGQLITNWCMISLLFIFPCVRLAGQSVAFEGLLGHCHRSSRLMTPQTSWKNGKYTSKVLCISHGN